MSVYIYCDKYNCKLAFEVCVCTPCKKWKKCEEYKKELENRRDKKEKIV